MGSMISARSRMDSSSNPRKLSRDESGIMPRKMSYESSMMTPKSTKNRRKTPQRQETFTMDSRYSIPSVPYANEGRIPTVPAKIGKGDVRLKSAIKPTASS